MSDLATTMPARPPAAQLLDKKMKKSHAMISGGVVMAAGAIGLGYIGVHIAQDFSGITITSVWPFVLLVHSPAHCSQLRVRQRFSRYRQCGRDGYLHPFA